MTKRISQNSRPINRHSNSLVFIVLAVLVSGCLASNSEATDRQKLSAGDSSDFEDDFQDELGTEYETPTGNIVEEFTPEQTALWKQRVFKGQSDYRSVVLDQRSALQATTRESASLLFRQQTVDLKTTPILSWTWKITNIFAANTAENNAEQTKAGDDFPARIYVVFRNGPLPGDAMAINYVWASAAPVGAYWPNPFQQSAIMMVVESGGQRAGSWITHTRNVAKDFKTLFGKDITTLHGYAVMVDGDNTGNTTTSWFDNLSFSAVRSGVLQ